MIFFMQLHYCANTIYDLETIENFNTMTSEDNNIFQFEKFNNEFNDALEVIFPSIHTQETNSVSKEQAIRRFKDYDEMLLSLETINFKLLDLDTIVDHIPFLETKLNLFKSTSWFVTYKKCNIIKRIRSRNELKQSIDKTRTDIHSKLQIFVYFDKNNFLKVVKYFNFTNFEKMIEIHNFFFQFINFFNFSLCSSEAESKKTPAISKYKTYHDRLTRLYEDPDFVFEILHILDSFKFHLTTPDERPNELFSFYCKIQIHLKDFLKRLKFIIDDIDKHCDLLFVRRFLKKKRRKKINY